MTFVFISAKSPQHWQENRDALAASGVKSDLLDCSDAHTFSSETTQKDRIGNCFTWLNADPSFMGLQHAIAEFESRVSIGDIPPKLQLTRTAPTRFATHLRIYPAPQSSPTEPSFNVDVPLNPGFVAVIGNRGKGKSAFADVMGLLGGSRNHKAASFLRTDRFRDPKDNKAAHFRGDLRWLSGEVADRSLDDDVLTTETERLKYLPQSLLETICNEIPGPDGTQFERELREVIYSHVPEAERLGEQSLDSLLSRLTVGMTERLSMLRLDLHAIHERIAAIEEELEPEHAARIQAELDVKENELAAHNAARPKPVTPPAHDQVVVAEMADLRQRIDAIRSGTEEIAKELQGHRDQDAIDADLMARADSLLGRLRNLRTQFETFTTSVGPDLLALGLTLSDVATLSIDLAPVEQKHAHAARERAALLSQLNAAQEGSPAARLAKADAEIKTLTAQLDEPNRLYQAYLQQDVEWKRRLDALTGGAKVPGTLLFVKNQLEELTTLPGQLETARSDQTEKARAIFAELRGLCERYREVYAPVGRFIASHPLAQLFDLNFEVSLTQSGLANQFLQRINRAVLGSFTGVDESNRILDAMISAVQWDDLTSVESFWKQLNGLLHKDVYDRPVSVSGQLRKGTTIAELYDLIWGLGFLTPRYQIDLQGTPLALLSPGQKGTLLLVFYLLVDKSELPLIIDQPEENLDNQTITSLLVPALKEARARRQLILVTHNPNIAVVGDADQVIHAEMKDGAFVYTPGAIEHPDTNKYLIQVLEGTRPAFENRGVKYAWELAK